KLQYLNAMRRLAMFLAMSGSNAEAVDLQKQIISQVKADHASLYEASNDERMLVQYEVQAGQGQQAQQILENNLLQAENTKGRGSPEYQMALNDLFWNRNAAGDYAASEKLAQ